MGAEHIEFVPSSPIHGVRRFFTTNGKIFINQEEGSFYIYDSCLMIRIDTVLLEAGYVVRPEPLYFGSISITNRIVDVELYSDKGKREKLSKPIDEFVWIDGLGAASDGVFPSAYMPWVNEREVMR